MMGFNFVVLGFVHWVAACGRDKYMKILYMDRARGSLLDMADLTHQGPRTKISF